MNSPHPDIAPQPLRNRQVPVSVLVPAKNEAQNLPACLQSLARAQEVFVVDSQSSDRTVEIARSFGAIVEQFYYQGGVTKKKNWALDQLPFRHEWVLIVDCDERVTDDLWDEIAVAIQSDRFDGYYLKRKIIFLGRWLRHGGKYPDLNLRLFRHRLGRYETLQTRPIPNTGDNEVHEHIILKQDSAVPQGLRRNIVAKNRISILQHDLIHEDCRDIFHWIDRHNRYSNWEAQLYLNFLEGKAMSNAQSEAIGENDTLKANPLGNALERKRFLRQLWVRLPFRPTIRFWVVYVVLRGFLDGKAGYLYARLISQYEAQIGIKLYELQRDRRSSKAQHSALSKPAENCGSVASPPKPLP